MLDAPPEDEGDAGAGLLLFTTLAPGRCPLLLPDDGLEGVAGEGGVTLPPPGEGEGAGEGRTGVALGLPGAPAGYPHAGGPATGRLEGGGATTGL